MPQMSRILNKVVVSCFALAVLAVLAGPTRVEAQNYNSLQSFNLQDHYIRHQFSIGKISVISSGLDRLDATFNVVPGLANVGGTFTRVPVSFESKNLPGQYLRHQNGRIVLSPNDGSALFRQDATFYYINGLANSSWASLESVNIPGWFIRHQNGDLFIAACGSDNLCRSDATFRLVSPLG